MVRQAALGNLQQETVRAGGGWHPGIKGLKANKNRWGANCRYNRIEFLHKYQWSTWRRLSFHLWSFNMQLFFGLSTQSTHTSVLVGRFPCTKSCWMGVPGHLHVLRESESLQTGCDLFAKDRNLATIRNSVKLDHKRPECSPKKNLSMRAEQ